MIGFPVLGQSFMVEIVIFAPHGDARNLLRHGPDRRNYHWRSQLVLRAGHGFCFSPFHFFGPQLLSPLAARPLQGVPLPPCDPEREISIFPALNAASSDGSLLFLQSDRA